MSFFKGRKEKFQQVPTLSGDQSNFLSQIFGNLGQGGLGGQGYEAALQNLIGIIQGSPDSFKAFEEPARQGFEQSTVPSILERFSGSGARSSSGLQQTLGQAGRGLESDLAQQRAGMQQNAVQQLLSNFMNQSQLGLGTSSFENVFRPGQQGIFGALGSALGPALGGLGQGIGQGLGLSQILKMLQSQG